MCVQRPIHVSTAITRTSWYRLMRPVKERSADAGLEVRRGWGGGGGGGGLESSQDSAQSG